MYLEHKKSILCLIFYPTSNLAIAIIRSSPVDQSLTILLLLNSSFKAAVFKGLIDSPENLWWVEVRAVAGQLNPNDPHLMKSLLMS